MPVNATNKCVSENFRGIWAEPVVTLRLCGNESDLHAECLYYTKYIKEDIMGVFSLILGRNLNVLGGEAVV